MHENKAESRTMSKQKNVLLIVSEDNGPHLGCYGDRTARTPHLDQLAQRGTLFAHHHTTQAVCSPGRASILTGLYPHQNGQVGLTTHKYAMYEPYKNLASILKSRGYRTARLGKLHVHPENAFPFDFVWNDPDYLSFRSRDVHKTAEVADEFIRESSEPFFMYMCYADAHFPMMHQSCGEPAQPQTGDDIEPLPFIGIDTPRYRDITASYYNCMNRLDTGVGALLAKLEAAGKADDTLVIFTTDHGLQFPRGKCTCYEPGLHVPLIVSDPDLPGGNSCDWLTSHVDILPTVLDCLNISARDEVPGAPGASLMPAVRSEADEINWRQYAIGEWTSAGGTHYYPQRSIRDARYKLIVNYLAGRESPNMLRYMSGDVWETKMLPEEVEAAAPAFRAMYARALNPPATELYDLQDDPYELVNLADDPAYRDTFKRLRDELTAWQRETVDRIEEPGVLERLTREHDEIIERFYTESDRGKVAGIEWHYAEYLAP